jgi:chemotaxis protein MotA
MDIATLLGIASGTVILFVSIVMNTGASLYLSPFSMLVTLGGTFAATLINFAISDVIGVLKLVKVAFTRRIYDHTKIITQIVHLTDVTRRTGTVGLTQEMEMIADEFLRKGLEMVTEGASDNEIRYVLETEISFTVERHKKGRELFSAMGKYAPGFGMIGTLIGLVQMLLNLTDPSQIGKPMAMALVTTFYGAILANLIFLPLAGKLKNRSAEETLFKELILEGIILINSGETPRQVGERLKVFLPVTTRSNFDMREVLRRGE